MSTWYSITVDIKGIKRNRCIRVSPEDNSDNDETSQPPPEHTHCICELVVYDTTCSINTRLYRATRSCIISTPPATSSRPYSDYCTIQIRTPFTISPASFEAARSRREKHRFDAGFPPESFAMHIALKPIHGHSFPPPMFEPHEFETFDHLQQAVADWKALFNPSEGDLTTAILDLPVLPLEEWEYISASDILTLSPEGEFGKWH
jgi:hypothetical protein